MQLLENHARAFYRLLNHGDEYTDLRCIDVNAGRLLDRSIVKGEEEVLKWARFWNGKGNCFAGRNPRNADGSVSAITTFAFDIDPIRPPRTGASREQIERALQAGRIVLSEMPSGLLAFSGNGALVIYRLAAPIRENFKKFEVWNADCERRLQELLDARGLNDIKIDPTHDAPRINKLLGSASVKGDRAFHRIARFIDFPGATIRSYSGDTRLPQSDIQAPIDGGRASTPMDIPGVGGRIGPAVAVEKDGRGGTRTLPVGYLAERIEVATRALARLNPKRREDYHQWLQVGMSLTELGIVGLQLWDAWSRPSPKYQEGTCATKWKTFKANPSGGSQVSVGSLLHWADQDNPGASVPGNCGQSHADSGGHDDAVSLDAFMSDTTTTTWLCRPFIARGALGFVAGLPETMKTWAMIDFAVECARGGGQWLGLFQLEGGTVLFVDQERDKTETRRRLGSVMRAKGLSPAQLKDRLFVRSGQSLRFDSEPSMVSFRAFLTKHKPDIVIIDSFATVHGKEENSRTEIQTIMERIKSIRNEFGCAIVFIDHENKGAFQARENKEAPTAFRMAGSVAKPAAAEFVLTVRRFDAQSCIIHHTKSTLAPASEPCSVRVEDVENGIVVRGQK